MKYINKTSRMTEAAIITAIATLFALISLNVIPLLIFIIPVPFIVLGVRRGLRYSLLSIVAASLLIGLLFNPIDSVLILGFTAIVVLPIVYLINKKYKTPQIVIGGAFFTIIGIIIVLMIISFTSDIKINDIIEGTFETVIDEYDKTFEALDLKDIDKEEVINILINAKNTVILLLPSSIIISSVIFSYINYLISILLLRRLGNKVGKYIEFKYFRLPSNVIPGTSAIFILTLVIRMLELPYYETITFNVFYILLFVFYIQGFAIIIYYLNRFKASKFLKALAVVFILLNSMVISTFGFINAFINFIKGLTVRNS